MRFGSAIVILTLSFYSTLCFAQDTPPKERLYDFDDMLIDGEFRDPDGMYERTRKTTKFKNILKIKRQFVPQIKDDEQEKVLEP